jgi:hypothetical protein
MFESGMPRAGTLAASARCAAGMLQQLRRAVAQRAAATAAAVPDARAADEELPADGARALNFFCAAVALGGGAAVEFNLAE